jgi:2-polyprenyl-3-methyl-5-hydroxy-6-metoxy-1,4-benzoquinol methylase
MEWRLFPEGTIPECATPEWYAQRDRAPHVDQRAHRPRLVMAAAMVGSVWEDAFTVSDMGAGDGGLLQLMDGIPGDCKWGYDLQPSNIQGAAERGVNVELGDVLSGDVRWGDVVVVTEMLEHLVDPHGFVATIPESVRFVVASSPVNETDRNHYEFHLWAWDAAGYAALFTDAGWTVVDHRGVGPYQVLLASRGV